MEQEDSPVLKRMFEMFDTDKSGQIDMREFLIGISGYTGASRQDRLKFSFMMFDEDASGSARTSARAFSCEVPYLKAQACTFDANGRGWILLNKIFFAQGS